MENNIAKENAFLIDKLLKNGFHIKGKANLSEWANFRSTKSVSGWSSINGQTTHHLDSKYNPCGSSSGSAVAVASGIVEIAIGTETNGSITCPASVAGIVGFKPTVGLVSRTGIIPIAESQDTAGPMGNTVEIIAKTMEAIAGPDPRDASTNHIPIYFNYNFLEFTKIKILMGASRLLDSGLITNTAKFSLKIINDIKKLGGEIVLIDDKRKYPVEEEYLVLLYEFKHGLKVILKTQLKRRKR